VFDFDQVDITHHLEIRSRVFKDFTQGVRGQYWFMYKYDGYRGKLCILPSEHIPYSTATPEYGYLSNLPDCLMSFVNLLLQFEILKTKSGDTTIVFTDVIGAHQKKKFYGTHLFDSHYLHI